LVEVLGDSFYGFVVACGGFTAHLIQLILFFHIFSKKESRKLNLCITKNTPEKMPYLEKR
jgi:hypothetical protein